MPTNRKKRSRKITKKTLSDFVTILLMDGREAEHLAAMEEIANPGPVRMSGKGEAFRMMKRPLPGGKNLLNEAWEIHKDEIWRLWKLDRRKGRPWAAKQYDDKRT